MTTTEMNLNEITRYLSIFNSFEALLTAPGNYRPTLYPESGEHTFLADAYDKAQEDRGDPRRAFRGSPRKAAGEGGGER